MSGPAPGEPPHVEPHGFDALLPPEMARRAEEVGVRKVEMDSVRTLLLAVLAGAFIALGCDGACIALTGTAGVAPWGWSRLVAGVVLSLGLGLVVVGGAELFTGNNLVVMAWASGRVRAGAVLRSWGLVYVGNTFGAVCTAAMVFLGGQHRFAAGEVGRTVLELARAKMALPFVEAFALGVLANALVCLAVWLAYSARTTVDRIVCVSLPVAAFVASGFEHCIANLFFLPLALFVRADADASFWTAIGKTPADYATVDVAGLIGNLVPVTLGNVVGGAGLVGLVYWAAYLRKA